jgi:hypothetical protein
MSSADKTRTEQADPDAHALKSARADPMGGAEETRVPAGAAADAQPGAPSRPPAAEPKRVNPRCHEP